MTLGSDKVEHVYHKKERDLVRRYLDLYNTQMKHLQPHEKSTLFGKNPKRIGLESKIELCEDLLGND